MRSTKVLFAVVSFLSFLVFFGCSAGNNIFKTAALQKTPEATAPVNEKVSAGDAEAAEIREVGYIKDVILEKIAGKERMSLVLSQVPEFTVSRESENTLMIEMKSTFLPDDLRERHSGAELRNLKYISLSQASSNGDKRVYVTVNLNEMVPYRVNQGESRIDVSFDISALAQSAPLESEGSQGHMKPQESAEAILEEVLGTEEGEIVKYSGEKISLDFQDANIRTVLRLISEVSGYNIVVSPDVKKTITVRMTDVPWDQALDTILEVNSLGKKQSGSVITVLPLEKLKKAKQEELEQDVAEGKLQQISIEARIVEASNNFARDIGIRWGYGYKDEWRSRDYGVMFGNSEQQTGATEVASLPGGIGLTSSNIAVNFPSATSAIAPALGVVFGSSKFILDARLEALESMGEGKIISSPKVTTLDNVKAIIKQGEEIPYAVTDSEGNRSIEFKDAALLLEVTPKITTEGKISMEVKATNDYADWAKINIAGENPPINTSSVESTIIVNDGDTIVVGGVYKTIESERDSGIPWLREMPGVGWLFKYKTKSKDKVELLIFVTPRIIKEG
jgi:type IV pilus assembly protein PilQ